MEDIVTCEEAALLTGSTVEEVREAIRSERLRAFRSGGQEWLSRADLIVWLLDQGVDEASVLLDRLLR